MFSLDIRIHSEVGRVRKNNQDAAFASPNLLVVADGMGGAAAGDLASAVAAKEARDGNRRLDDEHLLEHMAGIVQRANDKLADLIESDPELDGMGTTFSGAAFSGTLLGIAHIGDSRGYLLRDGELRQLTHDHSWVQSLIDEGRITPEQAATHPHRSLILKVLNGAGDTDPDFFELHVRKGDRLLFCSDGNISLVLAQVVPQSDELDAAEPQLAGSALEREIPTITHEEEGPGYPEPEPVEDPDHDPTEKARYAPRENRNKRRWPTVTVALLASLVVVGATFWGVRVYSSSRYFIASSDGRIGIYNGLPGALLGHEMNTLVERRDTRVSDLPVFFQRQVANTIGFSDLTSANEAANVLDGYASRCLDARRKRLGAVTLPGEPRPSEPEGPGLPRETSPTTPLSNSPGQTNYPTMLAPMSPTAAEEADPEAC